MNHIKILALAALISAVISAVFTHFSTISSTYRASSYIKNINIEEIVTSEDIDKEALEEGFRKVQIMSSPYEYPGFFRFWFEAFIFVFMVSFISCVLTYLANIKLNKT